jgi:hypothetical protein
MLVMSAMLQWRLFPPWLPSCPSGRYWQETELIAPINLSQPPLIWIESDDGAPVAGYYK